MKNHKENCICGVCKAIRGEYKGKNSPRWKGGPPLLKKEYFHYDTVSEMSDSKYGHRLKDGFMLLNED